jgi:hypothetical protein
VFYKFVSTWFADQTFVVRELEGEMGRSCAISLVVCIDSIVEQTALIQIVVRPPGSAEVRLEDALRGASKVSGFFFMVTILLMVEYNVECFILSTVVYVIIFITHWHRDHNSLVRSRNQNIHL